MSIVVLRGLTAQSLRNGRPLSTSLITTHLPSTRRYLRPQDHSQWRREATAALNSKTDRLAVPHHANPSSRGGLLGPACYQINPTEKTINLDLLPSVDDPARNGTLDTTRPIPLELPTQDPNKSKISYYISIGRTFYRFYKAGIKNIYRNWKEFSEIKAWIQPFTITGCAKYGGLSHTLKTLGSLPIPHIYRRQFQLYYRTRHDLLKLLPFSLILLIFGEFTPLVILALGNRVVPYTCRIPAQTHQTMTSAVTRFQTWRSQMSHLTTHSVKNPQHIFDYTVSRLEHPWRRDLLSAYLVGQSSISRPVFPMMSSFYWHAMLSRRLEKYWERIFCDNILICREGGFAQLSPQDIYEYALNYGLISLFVIMEKEVGQRKNYDFINEELKARLVPILEKEAEAMFDDDFTRLKPQMHWVRAYRDTSRWANSPDIVAAVEMMKEFGMPVQREIRTPGKGRERGVVEGEKSKGS